MADSLLTFSGIFPHQIATGSRHVVHRGLGLAFPSTCACSFSTTPSDRAPKDCAPAYTIFRPCNDPFVLVMCQSVRPAVGAQCSSRAPRCRASSTRARASIHTQPKPPSWANAERRGAELSSVFRQPVLCWSLSQFLSLQSLFNNSGA